MSQKAREKFQYINETIIREDRRRQGRTIRFLVFCAVLFTCAAALCYVLVRKGFHDGQSPVQVFQSAADESLAVDESPGPQETGSAGVITQSGENVQTGAVSWLDGYGAAKNAFVKITTVYGSGDWLTDASAMGSTAQTFGVVVAEDQYSYCIMTSADTMDSADEIYVQIGTEREEAYEVEAEEIFTDRVENFSLIFIEKESLPDVTDLSVIVSGIGSGVAVGDTVIAAGSPYSHYGSVNHGHVVYCYNQETYDTSMQMICTDMPADPLGCGVLLNQNGELIGWMVQRVGSDDVHMITAISMEEIYEIICRMNDGDSCAYLGIGGEQIPAETAGEYGIPQGLYLTMVADDGPAREAGIQLGDIVCRLDDTVIEDSSDLWEFLGSCGSGDSVTIRFMRMAPDGYTELEVQATLKER